MPFAYGTLGAHDDVNHYGSAKRDTAGGVAGVDSSSRLLSPGTTIMLTRDGGGLIAVKERTSNEFVISAVRSSANNYTLYNNTTAGGKILQDSSMKDVASGIAGLDASAKVPNTSLYVNVASGLAGLDAQKLIDSSLLVGFNLLKLFDNNIVTETVSGTGDAVPSVANGTVQLTTPANGDDIDVLENSRIALSLLPRIAIFAIDAITLAGATAKMGFGLAATTFLTGHFAEVFSTDGGANWYFGTNGGAGTNTAITAPAAGDVFILYAASDRCVLSKNGTIIAAHVANVPTNPLGHNAFIGNVAAGEGAGNVLTLGFMS